LLKKQIQNLCYISL